MRPIRRIGGATGPSNPGGGRLVGGRYARGSVQAIRELPGVEIEPSPPSAENGVASPKEVVGCTESWLVKQRPRRESTKRNGAVLGVPFESAEGRRCCAAWL